MQDIHLYESESGWAVSVDGREQRFATRSEAFAAASAAARAHSPSRVVRSAPPRPTTAPPPAARPAPPIDDDHDFDDWEAEEPLPSEAPYTDATLRRLERRLARRLATSSSDRRRADARNPGRRRAPAPARASADRSSPRHR